MINGVAPARERGLKYLRFPAHQDEQSRSRKGAWIEISALIVV